MILEIPLQSFPMQQFEITLEGQYCHIELLQRAENELYFSLIANNVAICDSVLCFDRVPVVATDYRGFVGNIYFEDTKGELDPVYTGFGSRYRLLYGDLPADPIISEVPEVISYLIMDNGAYITQDDGGLIIL